MDGVSHRVVLSETPSLLSLLGAAMHLRFYDIANVALEMISELWV